LTLRSKRGNDRPARSGDHPAHLNRRHFRHGGGNHPRSRGGPLASKPEVKWVRLRRKGRPAEAGYPRFRCRSKPKHLEGGKRQAPDGLRKPLPPLSESGATGPSPPTRCAPQLASVLKSPAEHPSRLTFDSTQPVPAHGSRLRNVTSVL
jgi:hypothetical protein